MNPSIPDMPVNVPVDDPNADTEWNDILRKHKIIPERPPSPTAKIQEALEQAQILAHEHRLEGKDLDELDALEDDEDEAFLDSYRQKRLAEIVSLQNASVYGQVYQVQKPEWSVQVTEASAKAWVFVLLTSSSGTNVESRVMIELWRDLARKFGDVKFCMIQGDLCIEGYPDRNCPTVLVYKDGDVKRQVVTLKELSGDRTGLGDMEKLIVGLGAVKHGDSRLSSRPQDGEEPASGRLRQGERPGADDDDDSDFD